MMDGAQSPALLVSMTRPAVAAFSDTGRLYAVRRGDTAYPWTLGADCSPAEFAIADPVDGVEFEPVGLAVSRLATILW